LLCFFPFKSGTWTKLGDEGRESVMKTFGADSFWPAAAGGAASFRIDGGMIICGGGTSHCSKSHSISERTLLFILFFWS
jgi:hypothetical protein